MFNIVYAVAAFHSVAAVVMIGVGAYNVIEARLGRED